MEVLVMRKSLVLLLVVVLFVSVLPAGAEIPKAPIKVGVVLPTSGAIAYDGGLALNGIKMAVDEINTAGGIKGNKIEIYIEVIDRFIAIHELYLRFFFNLHKGAFQRDVFPSHGYFRLRKNSCM